MYLELSEEHKKFRAEVREFAEKHIKPFAEQLDKNGEFPAENVKRMGECGYMGIPIPIRYGGLEKDTICFAIAVEEIARCCAATAATVAVHTSVGMMPIFMFGTEEQKKKYLPMLASGKGVGAFALTEPDAGSDVASLKTTATLEGEEYVINGSKIFITNSSVAETIIVFAKTEPEKGAKGISAFIVEPKNVSGFEVLEKLDKMGIRASDTCKIKFENTRIPKENLLGKAGEGFKMALAALDGGRIGIAAQAVGIMQAAYEESVEYAKKRIQFGQPIGNFQGIQWPIANMATTIEAARLLTYKAAWLRDTGQKHTAEASIAKLFASEAAVKVTSDAVQIHGGYGYLRGRTIERLYRDARITPIYEGTSEVQRLVIARELLR